MFSTAFIITPLVAALFVASPPLPTLVAAPAADATEQPRSVHVSVDVTELGPKGVGVDGLVLDKLTAKLQEAGFEVVEASAEAVQLRVRFVGLRVDKFDYGIHFELVDGDAVEPVIQWVACLLCVDANLLPLLDEHSPALIEALDRRLAGSATVEGEGEGEGAGDSTIGVDAVPEVGEPIAVIGPVGGVGIGVAALGLGAVVWGSVELGRGRVYEDGSSANPDRSWTDHRLRGRALLGAGLGGVALGTALIVTDVVIRAKRRKQAREQTGIVVPMAAPEGIGVAWFQRF